SALNSASSNVTESLSTLSSTLPMMGFLVVHSGFLSFILSLVAVCGALLMFFHVTFCPTMTVTGSCLSLPCSMYFDCPPLPSMLIITSLASFLSLSSASDTPTKARTSKPTTHFIAFITHLPHLRSPPTLRGQSFTSVSLPLPAACQRPCTAR